MINRVLFVLFLHSAAFAGTVSPVVLIGPSHFALTVPQMLPQSVMSSNPLFLPQMQAVVSNIPSPMYVVKANDGLAVIPQRGTEKAVLVPFKNSPDKPGATIPLTNKAVAELRSQLKSGDILLAQAALNRYFDNASAKDAGDEVRSYISEGTLLALERRRDGHQMTKVHKMETLPESVRAELAKGKNLVAYAIVLNGKKSFAVFNSHSASFGARGKLFGAKGQHLGRIQTLSGVDIEELAHW